jgi:hypothetical protein
MPERMAALEKQNHSVIELRSLTDKPFLVGSLKGKKIGAGELFVRFYLWH